MRGLHQEILKLLQLLDVYHFGKLKLLFTLIITYIVTLYNKLTFNAQAIYNKLH